MKHKITLSITLILSLTILLLTSSDSSVSAQNQMRLVTSTGVITLGANQVLRITVNAGDGNNAISVRFRQQEYVETGSTGGVRKLTVAAQNTSAPITLAPGEVASFNSIELGLGRELGCGVFSESPNVRVNAYIVNRVTGAFEANILRD